MLIAKLKYQKSRLTVLGSARDALLSDASPQVRQAVRELADGICNDQTSRRRAQG